MTNPDMVKQGGTPNAGARDAPVPAPAKAPSSGTGLEVGNAKPNDRPGRPGAAPEMPQDLDPPDSNQLKPEVDETAHPGLKSHNPG